MLRDVDLLSAKLGKVEGFGDTGDFLADLVKAKEVKDETPTEADETPTEAEETPTEDEEGADAVEVEAKAGETRSTEEHEGEGS